MCLSTKQKKPTVTRKDITCYKILRKDMTSYFHNHKWELGKLYETEMEDSLDGMYHVNGTYYVHTVNWGFHSYKSLDYVNTEYCLCSQPCVIVECTIPKGAKVYRGTHRMVAGYTSNQLIVNKLVEIEPLFPEFAWDVYPFKVGDKIEVSGVYGNDMKQYRIENIQPVRMSDDVYLIVTNLDDETQSNTLRTEFNAKSPSVSFCVEAYNEFIRMKIQKI